MIMSTTPLLRDYGSGMTNETLEEQNLNIYEGKHTTTQTIQSFAVRTPLRKYKKNKKVKEAVIKHSCWDEQLYSEDVQ